MTQIQQISPAFCQDFDPTPRVNNQKTRNARLLSNFYPELPVYALDERTLVMPYFDQPVTVEEIIQEAIRIFLMYRRVVADMGLVNHFKKDQSGRVYCTETAVTAMRVLADATQFQAHLKTIKDLALGEQRYAYLTLVHSLLRICKAYFENKGEALADRKKIFIQNCNRLLRQPLPALSSELATNTMQTAIRELKNALSLARDPTFYCMIS